jgi:hypothetical protein
MAASVLESLLVGDNDPRFCFVRRQLANTVNRNDPKAQWRTWLNDYEPTEQRQKELHKAMGPLRELVQAITGIGNNERIIVLKHLYDGTAAQSYMGDAVVRDAGPAHKASVTDQRHYERGRGGWPTYLAFLERNLMRQLRELYVENHMRYPEKKHISIRDIDALSHKVETGKLNNFRSDLVEILVADNILGTDNNEELVAMNYPAVYRDPRTRVESHTEIDVVTSGNLVEISLGRLKGKEDQFRTLARLARSSDQGLVLYFDPMQAKVKNIYLLGNIARYYKVPLKLRAFFWDEAGIFHCEPISVKKS